MSRATILAFHRPRFERMLRDLGLEAGSVLPTPDHALVDDISRRRLTPPLDNQTLAEGLASAIKLAALLLEEDACSAPRSGSANRLGGPE